MSFDPITYAAANAAKLPLGTIVDGIAGNVPNSDWVHLDGTLISKAAYPKAADILGERILFNETPTTVEIPLSLPANVSDLSSMKSVVIDNTLICAFAQSSSYGHSAFRIWRSTDAGVTWASVDLSISTMKYVEPILLEWFGDGRVVIVLRTIYDDAGYLYASCSNNYGQTWSAPAQLAGGYADSTNNRCDLSCDATLPSTGTGVYWLGVNIRHNANGDQTYSICSMNPATGAISNKLSVVGYTSGYTPSILGGPGNGDVYFKHGGYNSGMMKATLTNGTWSSMVSVSLTANLITGRTLLTRTAGGDYYSFVSSANTNNTALLKLPENWSGSASQRCATAMDAQKFFSGKIAVLDSVYGGNIYDMTTDSFAAMPLGANSGGESIKSRYGHQDLTANYVFGFNAKIQPNNLILTETQPWGGGRVSFRTLRAVSNFFGNIGMSVDKDKFVKVLQTVNAIVWTNLSTIKNITVSGSSSNYKLLVQTYNQANDYANYLHLPYLPGLRCKLR